ncbi:DinB family protein [Nocardiopsis lambiniae]|uniref:DinB family protein n=1 Tax=Nocardiopsis lambiniae TaxID=3075539 RepID=A0ABU2M2S5_9ACTN|nr:DinB family protein [Nocardiopsis sp. DSM 44743]MDT0326935.1 DinB family protein [Nocardiopsis sp. DSM 44743]
MSDARTDLLRRQFDLTWGLLEYHLDRLVPEDVLWEPAGLCWTMRPEGDGWSPDWADTEPDPVPVPTIGWLSWHIGWWWEVTLDHLAGRVPRDREAVDWPGPEGVVARLVGLREEWTRVLPTVDLDAPAPFPWPEGSGMTVADTAAWVNAELMKNAAEMGQLRMLRAVSSPGS